MLKQTFTRRFTDLEASFKTLLFTPYGHGMSGTRIEGGVWQQWATSAQSLIGAVFGEQSPHYRNFVTLYAKCGGSDDSLGAMKAVFASAKDDFEGGYVFDVDLRVSGEVFGDFVSLARTALSEGYKDVAAVLACAALEDALKRYATSKTLDVSDKTMQEVVNALKSEGLVSGAQKTLLDAMPKIRNYAMHADWAKLTEPDVSSVLGFVEQFLLTKYTGA